MKALLFSNHNWVDIDETKNLFEPSEYYTTDGLIVKPSNIVRLFGDNRTKNQCRCNWCGKVFNSKEEYDKHCYEESSKKCEESCFWRIKPKNSTSTYTKEYTNGTLTRKTIVEETVIGKPCFYHSDNKLDSKCENLNHKSYGCTFTREPFVLTPLYKLTKLTKVFNTSGTYSISSELKDNTIVSSIINSKTCIYFKTDLLGNTIKDSMMPMPTYKTFETAYYVMKEQIHKILERNFKYNELSKWAFDNPE